MDLREIRLALEAAVAEHEPEGRDKYGFLGDLFAKALVAYRRELKSAGCPECGSVITTSPFESWEYWRCTSQRCKKSEVSHELGATWCEYFKSRSKIL